jgi:hypothetical protein
MRSCFIMSSDTRGVAVAVSAMMGTVGKRSRKTQRRLQVGHNPDSNHVAAAGMKYRVDAWCRASMVTESS